jgi:hypothetical protein
LGARFEVNELSDTIAIFVRGAGQTNGVGLGTSGTNQPFVNGYSNVGAVTALGIQPNGGALSIGNSATITTINGTTASTSTTTGSLINSGGFGNAGAINTQTLNINGTNSAASYPLTVKNNALKASASQYTGILVQTADVSSVDLGLLYFTAVSASDRNWRLGAFDNGGGGWSKGTFPGLISITDTTASTSTTTGALIVSGGAGFAGNIHSGGTGNFNGVVTSLGGNAGVQVYDRSVGASDAWLMSATGGSNLTFVNNGNSELTVAKGGAVTARGSLRSTSATGGIGYATGAGGAVTQGTSRTTGVTLNNVAGAITLFTAAGSATWQSFTVTNSAVAATDTIIVNQRSGTDLYMMHVTAVGAGSFRISFATTGGTTSEAPVFNFAVIKAVSS